MQIRILFVAALMLSGCAPTITGGGGHDRWFADLMECGRENRFFFLIPDGGITGELHQLKCMRGRHWVRTQGYPQKWVWTGGATPTPLPAPSVAPPLAERSWDAGL